MSIEVLIPILALAGLSLFARATLGSWIAPGAFFLLFWTSLIIVSAMVPQYPPWHVALWWIFVALLLFFMGSFISGGALFGPVQKSSLLRKRQIRFPKLDVVVFYCSLLGILYILFRDVVSPNMMDKPPVLFQFLLAALYAAPLFGGMLGASDRSKRGRRLAAFSFVPAFFLSVAFMGRSPLLAGIFFWLAGFWSVRILMTGGVVPLLTPKVILGAPLLLAVLSVSGTVIGGLRAIRRVSGSAAFEIPLFERLSLFRGVLQEFSLSDQWGGFRGAVFGHPYSFSHYLKTALYNPPTPHFGALTFSGPLDLLGLNIRSHYESFEVDPGVMSNVYTLFMPPIEDFGLWGSLVVFFVAGLIAGWAYRRVAQGNLLSIPVLTMFYPHVMVIGGYFFAYNSMILAHVFVGGYLYWAQKKCHQEFQYVDGISN